MNNFLKDVAFVLHNFFNFVTYKNFSIFPYCKLQVPVRTRTATEFWYVKVKLNSNMSRGALRTLLTSILAVVYYKTRQNFFEMKKLEQSEGEKLKVKLNKSLI